MKKLRISDWLEMIDQSGKRVWFNANEDKTITPEEFNKLFPNRKKMGAPTKRTAEIIENICTGIAMGKSARSMCESVGISQKTLWNWLAEDGDFLQQYIRAKEFCADVLFDEIIEIADTRDDDRYIDENGREVTNHEAVNRSRLRVDARKWCAGKLAPKKYGDKVIAEHQGNPDQPIAHSINIRFIKSDTSAA